MKKLMETLQITGYEQAHREIAVMELNNALASLQANDFGRTIDEIKSAFVHVALLSIGIASKGAS